MEILLANPRGFCAGVDRAIEIVERALQIFGAPIYVRHEVVHNRYVVDSLKQAGAIFVDQLNEIPANSTVIFSAHGVAQSVRQEAERRQLQVFDATCPLVTKVHLEVARHSRNGDEVILIGHRGHPEVEGTMGQYNNQSEKGGIYLVVTADDVADLQIKDPERLAFVTQTTLSMDDTAKVIAALKERFPVIQGPKQNDICYATQNRQDAVKELAKQCDLVLVVGSPNSSNSNRLKELAKQSDTTAYLIDRADDINPDWLTGISRVGLTAGASAPDLLVEEVIEKLKSWGASSVQTLSGREENVTFSLPKALQQAD
ncbi:MAG: 4-hydroxy-3-methylbut-2-enyl diphosphate reductase [Sedimenticola thiotaurini]|uniref:4-hydroxy-3-methylbut-2-enyl diphosphate reductase n=1 Tax=Sedimenticola thiotaurini TaxID=1543721 RepID=A0A558CSK8_9GAMM|nr:MAG: 4-hydroxy-3-methylbut-2-enyl diphosphate reductase [Sedimenticola thiotaurini]